MAAPTPRSQRRQLRTVALGRDRFQIGVARSATKSPPNDSHPSYVEGQIQGGVTRGIGWALSRITAQSGTWDCRTPATVVKDPADAVLVQIPGTGVIWKICPK
jgi:hypothetical protein